MYLRLERGRWSIKAVLPPAAADMSYEGLAGKDDGPAQEAFLEAIAPGGDPTPFWVLEKGLKV